VTTSVWSYLQDQSIIQSDLQDQIKYPV